MKKVVPTDSRNLNNSQIACISCDTEDYPGELSVDETVRLVLTAQQTPAAVLLYSPSSLSCNFSADGEPESLYRNVFTFIRPTAADALRRVFGDSQNSSASTPVMNVNPANDSDSDAGGGGSGESPNTGWCPISHARQPVTNRPQP